jgi:BTB/POZ domain
MSVNDNEDMTAEQQIDFTETWSFADVCFLVEDKILWGNRATLGMWSPVFQAMFVGHFRERDSTEIPLPGKKFDAFHELLFVTHPPNKTITSKSFYFTFG